MNLKKIKIKNKKGFSLVEALIFSLIVVIVVVVFYRTFASGAKVLRDARARTAAAQVANEKFETLRSLPYGDLNIGTIEEDNFTRSSIKFKVVTNIDYTDDPYDTSENPAIDDEKPHDYKHVNVMVKWMSSGEEKTITMYTHIAPPGTEELYDGGILNIEIRDTNEQPVKGAEVKVKYLKDGTAARSFITGDNGKVYLIGYAAGDEDYYITVQKNNYYPVETFPPLGPSPNGSPFDPVDENATVIENGITSMTIHLEELASMQMKTVDPFGTAVGDINFSLEGGRKIGDLAGVNVYSHTKTNESSNASGEFVLPNESPGNYIFEYLTAGANIGYEFWKLDPTPLFGRPANSFYLAAGSTSSVNMIIVPKNVPSLFLTVLDKSDSTPIEGATVKVANAGLAYDKQLTTDKFGKVYFPVDEDPLVQLVDGQEYAIDVEAGGYSNKQTMFTISGLTKSDILME